MFEWLVAAAIIDEYRGVFAGILVGLPLCFVNPILGVIAGFITMVLVNRTKESE